MGDPSQAQWGVGQFLKGLLGGGTEAAGAGYQGEEKAASQKNYFKAMSDLKDRELGAQRSATHATMEEANTIAEGAHLPFHFTKDVPWSFLSSITTQDLRNKKPPAQPRTVPTFNAQTARNQALIQARRGLPKEYGNLGYEDMPAAAVEAFNKGYQGSYQNALDSWTHQHPGYDPGFDPGPYLEAGTPSTGLGGLLGFGSAKVKNKILDGYLPRHAPAPAAGAGGPAAGAGAEQPSEDDLAAARWTLAHPEGLPPDVIAEAKALLKVP